MRSRAGSSSGGSDITQMTTTLSFRIQQSSQPLSWHLWWGGCAPQPRGSLSWCQSMDGQTFGATEERQSKSSEDNSSGQPMLSEAYGRVCYQCRWRLVTLSNIPAMVARRQPIIIISI
jgi:hypothetical protein